MKNLLSVLSLLLISIFTKAQNNPVHEFRAVWIATVENIDWPSKRGLSSEDQKAEFIKILDLHKRNGMNAIVMQIRPVTDAFFPSKYEPWSEYLTGKQGTPPSPYYDPLAFMIDETHKRGMEFHAWINPYRAVFNVARSSVSPSHVTRLFPNWFITYGTTKYFNPALPEAREHVTRVIKDVVERYDLDGIHFDDYFYPYPIAGKPFPDEEAYQKYGNGLNKADWRRSNVDTIIKMLSETIKAVNPRVKFGISPFGIWRNISKDPMGSNTRGGLSNYDDLYADILLWLQKGWIDYVVPQLYWEIGHPLADYNTLLTWWSKYTFGKHLFIGHAPYRNGEGRSVSWKNPKQIPSQIKALRNNSNALGSVYFSSKSFNNNPAGWNDSLRNNYYKYPALVPPMKWIDSVPPLKPLVEKVAGLKETRVMYRGAEPIKGFAIYSLPQGRKPVIESGKILQIIIAEKYVDIDVDRYVTNGERIYIASVDRNNNVSEGLLLR
jgi:uncharacterized lipoprotein YddW (UPF0748 family)